MAVARSGDVSANEHRVMTEDIFALRAENERRIIMVPEIMNISVMVVTD